MLPGKVFEVLVLADRFAALEVGWVGKIGHLSNVWSEDAGFKGSIKRRAGA
jgi:hypothetical protein